MENTVVEYGAISAVSEAMMDRFIDYTGVKDITMKGYKVCLRQFGAWMAENGISNPTRDDIKAYNAELSRKGYKAGTKAQYLRAVKHFFKWTAAEGIYADVASNIKGAKVRADNTKKEAFSEEDVRAILSSIDTSTEAGLRDYIMILLAVTGGLRIIEMQRANVEDIQTIRGERVLFIQGKGHDEKDAYVKLIPEVDARIREYLEVRSAKKNEPLFSGTGRRAHGHRLEEPSISRIIKTRFKEAGYDSNKLTAHSLRHTSNTLLFKSGADLYKVQKHARHADPRTTEIYLHAAERESDHSEMEVYNQIYGLRDPAAEAAELLSSMHGDELEEALEALKAIKERRNRKGA